MEKNKVTKERNAKLCIEKELHSLESKLEKIKQVKTEPKSSQTDANTDTPYNIEEPLPPIFSSDLCRLSPKIHFLSKSLPNLDSICWVKPDTMYQDEAQEALNSQYDRQIVEFYISERERVSSLRETSSVAVRSEPADLSANWRKQEGHIILNLSDSEESSVSSSSEEFG